MAQGIGAFSVGLALLALVVSLYSVDGVLVALLALLFAALAACLRRVGMALLVGLLVTFNVFAVTLAPQFSHGERQSYNRALPERARVWVQYSHFLSAYSFEQNGRTNSLPSIVIFPYLVYLLSLLFALGRFLWPNSHSP